MSDLICYLGYHKNSVDQRALKKIYRLWASFFVKEGSSEGERNIVWKFQDKKFYSVDIDPVKWRDLPFH